MENDKVCARIAITGPHYDTEKGAGKVISIHYIGTVVTSSGQLWDVRWNGVSVTQEDIRRLWRDQFDLFKKRDGTASA